MDKPARTAYPVNELIAARWSPRALDPRPVPTAQLRSMLEAARWAASAFNEQPWRFIVARHDDTVEFEKMLACLVPGNQWASSASVLMLTAARATFSRNDKPNRTALHDLGLAVGNLSIQATAFGLRVHQMAGIEREKIRETYAIPEGFDPVTAIAIGAPGDPARLPDGLREAELAPRERKPQRELVFAGTWGREAHW